MVAKTISGGQLLRVPYPEHAPSQLQISLGRFSQLSFSASILNDIDRTSIDILMSTAAQVCNVESRGNRKHLTITQRALPNFCPRVFDN